MSGGRVENGERRVWVKREKEGWEEEKGKGEEELTGDPITAEEERGLVGELLEGEDGLRFVLRRKKGEGEGKVGTSPRGLGEGEKKRANMSESRLKTIRGEKRSGGGRRAEVSPSGRKEDASRRGNESAPPDAGRQSPSREAQPCGQQKLGQCLLDPLK